MGRSPPRHSALRRRPTPPTPSPNLPHQPDIFSVLGVYPGFQPASLPAVPGLEGEGAGVETGGGWAVGGGRRGAPHALPCARPPPTPLPSTHPPTHPAPPPQAPPPPPRRGRGGGQRPGGRQVCPRHSRGGGALHHSGLGGGDMGAAHCCARGAGWGGEVGWWGSVGCGGCAGVGACVCECAEGVHLPPLPVHPPPPPTPRPAWPPCPRA